MTEAKQRLFFALWPDEVTRKQLFAAARQLDRNKGRLVAADNLHITLAFIGASTAEQRACYCRAADKIKAAKFSVTLDSFGYWKKPRVAFLGCSRIPPSLSTLVSDLNEALEYCGYVPERRRYDPHVTLMRKAQGVRPVSDFKPLTWHVDRFCLVESITRQEGVEYHVLRQWQFD